MKILCLGDTHTNAPFIDKFYSVAVALHDPDVIVQVGDFGFWENRGPDFLDIVNDITTEYNKPFYWIDGNHENHELLHKNYVKGCYDDFVQMRSNIFYIPRGHTWEWDGLRFMGFGGAYSINKASLTPYINWFPEEMPSEEDIARANNHGKVDVLICHDTPEGTPLISFTFGKDTPKGCMWSRKKLREVADSAQPKLIVHGHYHHPYTETWFSPWGDVKVIGLSGDYVAEHWSDMYTIIDTEYHPTW